MSYLLIGMGGSLGAISRYLTGIYISKRSKSDIPVGTLLINILGSFLLGLVLGDHSFLRDWHVYLIGIGFCGAFTTFSTFGYETIQLFIKNKPAKAVIYILLSTIFSFVAATIGLYL